MSYNIVRYCRKFTLANTFVLLCLASNGQYNFSGLDKFFIGQKKSFGNDFAALIYKDGKIIYQKETEEFKIKSKAMVSGSSQWLTAALVMTFVDEGIITLDDRISTYLPIFETYGKSYITIRQCLSHQTGIEDNQKLVARMLQRKKFESLEEEVNSFAKREIAANPGTTFNYGGIGPSIAGRVLEIVSKRRFELLAKQRLFTPLNMRNTTFIPEENSTNPASGAGSTAADYLNFLTMLLNKGMFMGKRVLSEAAVIEMQTIQTGKAAIKYQPEATIGYQYGLGTWIIPGSPDNNKNTLSAGGNFGTIAYLDQCKNYAAIVLPMKLQGEQSNSLQNEMRKLADTQMPANCQ